MAAINSLLQKIEGRCAVIGVIGLGYVGLPLCKTFHDSGFTVIGFDVDERKVAGINAGSCHIPHFAEEMAELTKSQRFSASTEMNRLGETDVAVICVPTPVGKHLEADLSYILKAGQSIANTLHAGQLVVLESTTYPGTTDEDLRQVLDSKGLKLDEDYFLAFSPEREDPGNRKFAMKAIPKLVGGVGPGSRSAAEALYKACFERIHVVSSTRVAESAKLVENIYRAVNIALVNELKVVFSKMDIDIWEVLDAAETKPFGFNRFNPGPGWGGHCIPVDPFYLTWRAKASGVTSHFIELAGEINTQMPHFVVQQAQKALNKIVRKSFSCAKVLLLGVAYKSNISDTRETPAFVIWKLLKDEDCTVSYHDPHVPEITDAEHFAFLRGEKSVALTREYLKEIDMIITVTHHDNMDMSALEGFAGCIVDTRNCVTGRESWASGLKIVKA